MRTRPTLDGNVLMVPVPDGWRDNVAVTLEKASRLGGIVDVDICLPRRPRTTGPGSQSAKLHALLNQIAMRFDTDLGTAKRYVKVRACSHGYPYKVLKDGERTIVEPQSEAKASTEEESLLITTCYEVAGEHGWALEDGE